MKKGNAFHLQSEQIKRIIETAKKKRRNKSRLYLDKCIHSHQNESTISEENLFCFLNVQRKER